MATKKMSKERQEKRVESETLSLADRYYVENNGNLSIEQISQDLGKPIKVIADFCQEYLKNNPQQKKYKAKDLLDRPSVKGVVSMTGAASMAGDDAIKKVSLEDINNAIIAGNFEFAKILKERFDKEAQQSVNAVHPNFKNAVHYIIPPEQL